MIGRYVLIRVIVFDVKSMIFVQGPVSFRQNDLIKHGHITVVYGSQI